MIGTTERLVNAVSKAIGSKAERGVFIARQDNGYSIIVGPLSELALSYNTVHGELTYDSSVFTSDEISDLREAVDAILAPVDGAYLDALPERTLVRVVEVRDYSLRDGGKPMEVAYLYEKFAGDRWLHLDPSDRYDGEETVQTPVLFAIARRYRAPGDGDPGRIEIVYVPDDDDA